MTVTLADAPARVKNSTSPKATNKNYSPAEVELATRERLRRSYVRLDTTPRQRFRWDIFLSDMTPNAKLVALALLELADGNGLAVETSQTLELVTSLSKPTLLKARAELSGRSFMQVEPSKGRAPSRYRVSIPMETVAELSVAMSGAATVNVAAGCSPTVNLAAGSTVNLAAGSELNRQSGCRLGQPTVNVADTDLVNNNKPNQERELELFQSAFSEFSHDARNNNLAVEKEAFTSQPETELAQTSPQISARPPSPIVPLVPRPAAEPVIHAAQVSRWRAAASIWGMARGERPMIPIDPCTAEGHFRAVILTLGREYAPRLVEDAVELALTDVEARAAEGASEKTRPGLSAMKRYFEKAFQSKLDERERVQLQRVENIKMAEQKAKAQFASPEAKPKSKSNSGWMDLTPRYTGSLKVAEGAA